MHVAKALFEHLADELPITEQHGPLRFHSVGELAVPSGTASVFDPTSGEADVLEVPAGSHRVYVVVDAAPGAEPVALGVLLWFGGALPVERGEYAGGVLTHCGAVCLSGADGDDALVGGLVRLAGQELRRRAEHGRDRGLLPVFEDACGQYRPDALQPVGESAPGAFRDGWHLLSDEESGTSVLAVLDHGEGGSIYPCLDAYGSEVAHLVEFETD
ncbi:hypothetical protein ACFW1A_33430 [Kitasatospora sp. NPDC058965]|uniref:hypothetical protein n=1 Tax=Kitasatospora sp. NPDC058965 TaxID=3346682 RepID=UPI0036ADD018